MIGPVSSTGRAMMASLQQAIEKGMPPDQAIQYVKSMATQGVAPLADLYAMMNQFQRLKQQPVQPPQTPPTIKDQLNMMDQQHQMQERAMAQGLGAMNAGAMENPRFAGGGIVAFAQGEEVEGGGPELEAEVKRILAKSPVFRTPEENEVLRSAGMQLSRRTIPKEGLSIPYADVIKKIVDPSGITGFTGQIYTPPPPAAPAARPASAASTGTGFVPGSQIKSFDDMAAAARAGVRQDERPATRAETGATSSGARSTAGTGGGRREAADPFAELRRQVEGRKFEKAGDTYSPEEMRRIEKELGGLEGEKKNAARMALARAGFSMAAAASRAGRQRTTGLGALAEGALGGMEQYAASQKELRQTERQLGKEMSELRKYQDLVARGDITAERGFEEEKFRTIADLENKRLTYLQNERQMAMQLRIAQLRTADQNMTERLMGQYLALDKITDPVQRKAAEEKFNRDLAVAEKITGSITAGGAGANARRDALVVDAVAKERETREYRQQARIASSESSSEKERQDAQAKMQQMEREAEARTLRLLGGTSGIGGVTPATNTGYVPTISGW